MWHATKGGAHRISAHWSSISPRMPFMSMSDSSSPKGFSILGNPPFQLQSFETPPFQLQILGNPPFQLQILGTHPLQLQCRVAEHLREPRRCRLPRDGEGWARNTAQASYRASPTANGGVRAV